MADHQSNQLLEQVNIFMMKKLLNLPAVLIVALASCKSGATAPEADATEPIVPVTVTFVSTGAMEETAELNATSIYLQKWILKSNVTGYLQSATLKLNMPVKYGQVLFTAKTKEAQSIGNTINKLDPNFKFTGLNSIRSNGSGFISELNHQSGDYVQDGEQLAVITDANSFVFLLDLPYELRPYILKTNAVQIVLPDGEKLLADVGNNLPSMDSASQTQRVILKVHANHSVPENLVAKVRLVKRASNNASYLPKAAVLTDETQTIFWVMKILNDSTAVKVEIKKGIEAGGNIEIAAPLFTAQDKVLLTGNFGLADTAKVKIVSPASKE